jgi:hypothetical protein
LTLSGAQQEFTRDIAKLIEYIYEQGYACTFGDAYRSPKAHGGMGENGPYGRARSAHKQRLAVDFNLFLNGKYLTKTSDHKPFGQYWKSLRDDNRWGGDFMPVSDGNHYSKRYGGIA